MALCIAAERPHNAAFQPAPYAVVRYRPGPRTGVARRQAPRLHHYPGAGCPHPGKVNEVAMSGNVLQTWTPAWLLLAVMAIAAVPVGGRHRVGSLSPQRVLASSAAVDYCAAPMRVVVPRRNRAGRPPGSRDGAAVLLVLLAQGARNGSVSR
jgi:hypothetical protein